MPVSYDVLLVEDSEAERYLFRRACEASPHNRRVHEVVDGHEALLFLHKQEQYSEAPTPDVVVLDLNLPKLTGHEVLQRMKQDSELRLIPVIILTVSNSDEDVDRCYALGASAFVRKPDDFELFCDTVSKMERFWLDVAVLPFKYAQKASVNRVLASLQPPPEDVH